MFTKLLKEKKKKEKEIIKQFQNSFRLYRVEVTKMMLIKILLFILFYIILLFYYFILYYFIILFYYFIILLFFSLIDFNFV